jgi:hypothetical protein
VEHRRDAPEEHGNNSLGPEVIDKRLFFFLKFSFSGLEAWLKKYSTCFASVKPWVQTSVPPKNKILIFFFIATKFPPHTALVALHKFWQAVF